MGALHQRLAAHVGLDLLVQGRPPDHARSPTTRRFSASRSSTRARCGRRASSSKRRCGSSGASQALVSYALQRRGRSGDRRPSCRTRRATWSRARSACRGRRPGRSMSVEAHVSEQPHDAAGSRVPAAATVNMTLIQPLGRSWELFGSVRNLFDAEYADPASEPARAGRDPPERPDRPDRAALEAVAADDRAASHRLPGSDAVRAECRERSLPAQAVAVLHGPGARRRPGAARSQLSRCATRSIATSGSSCRPTTIRTQLETRRLRPHSVHLGVLNTAGRAGRDGAARRAQRRRAAAARPLHALSRRDAAATTPRRRVVEVSRLSVSRQYNRRAGDGFYSSAGAGSRARTAASGAAAARSCSRSTRRSTRRRSGAASPTG